MSRVRLLTFSAWAGLVLRDLRELLRLLRELRKEVNNGMATLQEQIDQLSGSLDGIVSGIQVVQGEVSSLVAEIADMNAHTPPEVDLSPLQVKAQRALDMLGGLQQQAQQNPAPEGDAGTPTA